MDQPQPKQRQALLTLSEYPVLFYGGAKGGGKSWLARYWMLLRRLKYPGTTGVIVRKTYAELSANHIEKFWQEYPILRQYYNKSDKVIRLPNGSLIYFRHLSHVDDVYNFQGAEYDDIVVDECTQHSEETFKTLRSSNRTINPNIKPRFLLTGNPGGIGHGWVKRIFIDRNLIEGEEFPEEFGFVQAKVYDNDTLMENDPDYVRRLEGLPEEKRRMYLDGDWDVFAGQFFSMWRQEKHVIEPRYNLKDAPTSWTYRLGLDNGTLRPRAAGLLVQDNDGRVEQIWEYYKAGETASVAAYNMKAQLEELGILKLLQSQGRIIYDPAMRIKNDQTNQASIEVMSSILGITAVAGVNDRMQGASVFQDYMNWNEFDEPMFKVWNTCRNTVRTLPELVYDENGKEDVNTDGDDHIYDADRYALMSFPVKPQRFKSKKPVNSIERYTKKKSIWER